MFTSPRSAKSRLIATALAALLLPMFPSGALATENATEAAVIVTHSIKEEPMVLASSTSRYETILNLSTVVTSPGYALSGANVSIAMTCSSTKSGTFTVSLYRLTDGSFIGSVAFKRQGYTKATWTNVGSGTYYFKYSKASDGTTVTSSSVVISSSN